MNTMNPIIVTGMDDQARIAVFQAMSSPSSVRRLSGSDARSDGSTRAQEFEIGIIPTDSAAVLPLYTMPLRLLPMIHQAVPQSLGFIAVINSCKPDPNADEYLPTLEELTLQHGKPMVVVATNSSHQRAQSPADLRHTLGLSTATQIFAWSEGHSQTVRSVAGVLLDCHQAYAQRHALVTATLDSLVGSYGEAIRWAVIASREGVILGSVGLSSSSKQSVGGLSTAVLNVYDHALTSFALGSMSEALIFGADGMVIIAAMGVYMLVIQATEAASPLLGMLRFTIQTLIEPFLNLPFCFHLSAVTAG